jgi:hypothetical protein
MRSIAFAIRSGMAATIVCLLAAAPAHAGRIGGFHGARDNAAGGVTAESGRAIQGEDGGAVSRRGVATDGQGDAAGGSFRAFKGPNGAAGAQGGKWSHSANGTTTHSSAGAVSGARGSAKSSGSFSKQADGTASGQRSTTATGSNGGTYDGSTTYSSSSGAQHTGTCTNASGQTVACSR